jgi:hypothetical protein
MSFRERYNSPVVGVISGLILPVIGGLIFYLATAKGLTIAEYYKRTITLGNLTEIMSVAVFSNIIIFLLFNRLDMLNASKGVLGITIVWALFVFGIKLF